MIDTIITETNKLADLINQETEQLLHTRPASLADFIAQKDQHASQYIQLVGALKPLQPTLAAQGAAIRQEMARALSRLNEALLRNGDVLMHLQKSSRDLLETLATALNPHAQRPALYSAPGHTVATARNSIALNATV